MDLLQIIITAFVKALLNLTSLLDTFNIFGMFNAIASFGGQTAMYFAIFSFLIILIAPLFFSLFVWISSRISGFQRTNYITALFVSACSIYSLGLLGLIIRFFIKNSIILLFFYFFVPIIVIVLFIKLFYKENWMITLKGFLVFYLIIFILSFLMNVAAQFYFQATQAKFYEGLGNRSSFFGNNSTLSFHPANMSAELDKCEKIGSDRCYYNVSTKFSYIEGCRLILDEGLKSNCIYNIAKYKRNVSWCDEITQVSYKNLCFQAFTDKKMNDSYCLKIENLREKLFCRAKAKKDFNICLEGEDEKTRNACLYRYGTELKDDEACNDISVQHDRDTCYSSIARNRFLVFKDKEAITICDNIDSIKDKAICKSLINNNSIECSKISDIEFRDGCYYGYAVFGNHPDACEKLSDNSLNYPKDACLGNFG